MQGKCFKGDKCSYAHNIAELKEIPNLLKTKLCANFISGFCANGDKCNYAHGFTELRKFNANPSNQICSYFQQGMCKFGNNCKFLHITNSQAKYYGMKNKSSIIDRASPWEYDSSLMSGPMPNDAPKTISPDYHCPFNTEQKDVEQEFFEYSKSDMGEIKMTVSYNK